MTNAYEITTTFGDTIVLADSMGDAEACFERQYPYTDIKKIFLVSDDVLVCTGKFLYLFRINEGPTHVAAYTIQEAENAYKESKDHVETIEEITNVSGTSVLVAGGTNNDTE